MDHGIDLTDDVLNLLFEILGTCERVLARADSRPRLARIRSLGAELSQTVLAHWAELAAEDSLIEEQLEYDLARACHDPDDIPF